MSKRAVQSLRRYLCQVSDEAAAQADAQLLRQFIDANDHQAFDTLLARHGPMVLGTARRLVNNAADAADVFQAAFLSLARLAKSIRQGQSLPNWLYTTTCRIAARARKRRVVSIENAPEPSTAATAETDLAWCEVRTALDEELQLLPERLRLPLLLCYLSGMTRDEAAEQLGWSISTLKRRLEEGRAALRRRLERRGISAAGLALAVLSPSVLNAAVCPALTKSCLDAVSGKGVAVGVSTLVLTTTKTIKGIAMKAVIISLALVSLGFGIHVGLGRADGHSSAANAAQTAAQPLGGFQGPAVAEQLQLENDEPTKDEPKKEPGPKKEPEPITLKGHTCDVWSVCFSPNGKRIVTAGGVVTLPEKQTVPGEVKVWDAEKGTEILTLKGQAERVCSVCFSPDGKRIAGASSDRTVRIWDAENGQELLTLKGLTRSIGSVCFSPDSKRMASISSHDTVKVWDAEKGEDLLTLKGQVRPIFTVCFSPDGKRIAASITGVRMLDAGELKLFNTEIKVWDAQKGEQLLSLKLSMPGPASVCFSPDGKRLASAGPDEMVRIWDAEKGQELQALKGHGGRVNTVCFSPDGKRLASGSYDQTVKVWDAEKGLELLTLKGHTDILRCICFSPDGKRLASASKDKTAKVWSVDMKK